MRAIAYCASCGKPDHYLQRQVWLAYKLLYEVLPFSTHYGLHWWRPKDPPHQTLMHWVERRKPDLLEQVTLDVSPEELVT